LVLTNSQFSSQIGLKRQLFMNPNLHFFYFQIQSSNLSSVVLLQELYSLVMVSNDSLVRGSLLLLLFFLQGQMVSFNIYDSLLVLVLSG
jgi:hypothetical protein